MGRKLNQNDPISGKEGVATAIIDGRVQELFYIKKVEGKFTKTKADVKAVGVRATMKKTTGWEGSGTLTLYYVTSMFRKLIVDYIKTGKDFDFTLNVTNEDPSSPAGKQTVALYGCNVDEATIALLDAESDALEEEIPFTWVDADLLNEFNY